MEYARDEFDDGDEADEHDEPVASDVGDDDGEADTAPCPYCGKQVYDAADVCPHCHSFISMAEVRPRRPWWLVAGVVVCVVVVMIWVVRNA
jgi:hypothetical protein